MSLTIYRSIVPTYLQILGALDKLVDKAEAHCKEHNLAKEELLHAALAPDMFNFCQQIHQALSHSARAIKCTQEGVFAPDISPAPEDFDDLRSAIQAAIGELQALDENSLESLAGKAMRFEFAEYKMSFVAEEFLLTFSQPNFFFHATTAYDILRSKGVSLTKGDYMGALRLAG